MQLSPNQKTPIAANLAKSFFLAICPAFVTILLLISLASPIQAAITWIGDIDPTDPTTWTSSTDGYIGKSSTGTITVDGASALLSRYGYLGSCSGSSGTATVTGTNSKWTNSDSLYVGYSGAGALNIEAGGQVSSSSGYLGYNSGSSGTATVTGIGSQWTNSGSLYVGNSGASTLNVNNGGTVVVGGAIFASLNSLLGNGTISANGGVVDSDLVFNAAHSSQSVSIFGVGGTLTITPSASNSLGVGYRGSGTLRIAEGVTVASKNGYLGYYSGSTGTATVTGANSKWINSGTLYVGNLGAGTLNIEAGGQVSNTDGYLGRDSGTSGTATVTGTNSKWTNSGTLYVGYSGAGTLNIEAGGQVSNTDGYLGRDSGTSGTATVTGTNSKWTNSGTLYVGYFGTGTLNIEAGGQVSSFAGDLGCNSGSTGSATVTGANSKWTVSSNLLVGNSGTGTLTVNNGGMVVVGRSIFASLNSLLGNGTISANGGVVDADLVFNAAHRSQNTLIFGSGGTLTITPSASNPLGVGYKDSGTLQITEGVTVTSSSGILGYNPDSSGTSTVTGANSKWINSGSLFVGGGSLSSYYDDYGDGGAGTLNIQAGGQVSNTTGFLGYNSGSSGTATVTGANSKWTNSGDLYVGHHSGTGTLNIQAGGQVSSVSGYLGFASGSSGTATVTGANSKWTVNSTLYVGYSGTGTLNIEAGGQVSSVGGYLGFVSGSSGTATVTGTGSRWTTSNDLYVGKVGIGILTVDTGGTVVVGGSLYASNLLGNGTISANGGVLDVGLVFDAAHGLQGKSIFGSGGTLTITQSASNPLGVGYRGNGTLRITQGVNVASNGGYLGYYSGSSGTATVTGANSKWTNSGVLYVGYSGDGTLNIEAGGQVSNTDGYLGYNSGISGTATVTGTNSKWTVNGDLYVGKDGNGTLTVNNGGTVVVGKSLYASNLLGNGTISANGGVVDSDLIFNAAHRLQSISIFGSGGTLTITPSTSNPLGVGYQGSGTLQITEGVTIASSYGYLGNKSGSSGTTTVTGANSNWTNSSTLYIGNSGTGTLNIEAGGQVSSVGGYLGYKSGSSGTATVTGANSNWTNSSTLYVGYAGTGTLNIEAGGQVSYPYDGYLGYYSGTSGTVTVTGANSKWTNGGDLYVGNSGTGTLNIEAGGQVSSLGGYLGDHSSGSSGTATVTGINSIWKTSSDLYVGYSGTGSLNIEAGGQVSSAGGYLGFLAGTSGTATVTGTNSIWTVSNNLYVGVDGSGTLSVNNGGTIVVGKSLYASNLLGNGTISANGGVVDSDLVFNAAHGSQSISIFGSGGTLTITPSASNTLGVGYKGTGTLQITEGITVTSLYGYLGYKSGSSGTATVTGANSNWTNSSTLYVGYAGTGTLNIEAGGQVSNSNNGYLGLSSGTSGTATVTGTGSKWTNSGSLSVGHSGAGTLNIGSGVASDGLVYANSVKLANNSGATALCNLNGGTLQTSSISKGTGTATFNWSDGTIRNYDASTDLTVSGSNSLTLKLAATGTHDFNIDAGRMGTVSAVLCDLTDGGTLAKVGDGLLVLNAANTYSGTTTIDGGQLKLVAGGDIAFSSEIKNNAAFLIDGGNHLVQKITGSGSTQVLSGSLTVSSVVQGTLAIGGTTLNAVPEPSSLILLALFTLVALLWRRSWGS